MTIPADERPIESRLPDLGEVELGDLPELDAGILGEVIGRILPEDLAVPVAAFNSAI